EAHLAARRRPHGLEELVGAGLLEHVAGRARLDDVHHEAVLQHGGEGHHLDVGEAAPYLARGLHAVHHGHEQVHDDDVGHELLDELHGLAPVAGLAHHLQVGLEAEGEPQPPPHHRVVVYEQDADLVHRSPPDKATAGAGRRASDCRRRAPTALGQAWGTDFLLYAAEGSAT